MPRSDELLKTSENMLKYAKAHDAGGHKRWRLNIHQPWSRNDTEPLEYFLEETGDIGWHSNVTRLKLSPELGQLLEPFWKKNSYGEPIGGLKFSGIFHRIDVEEGIELYSVYMKNRKHAHAIADFNTNIKRAERLLKEFENMHTELQSEVLGLMSKKARDGLMVAFKLAHKELEKGIKNAISPADKEKS